MPFYRIFLPIVFAFMIFASQSCAAVDPTFHQFIHQKYPNCDILKIKEVAQYRVVTLQCGVQIKVVKYTVR